MASRRTGELTELLEEPAHAQFISRVGVLEDGHARARSAFVLLHHARWGSGVEGPAWAVRLLSGLTVHEGREAVAGVAVKAGRLDVPETRGAGKGADHREIPANLQLLPAPRQAAHVGQEDSHGRNPLLQV